jgi:hypothetical protein
MSCFPSGGTEYLNTITRNSGANSFSVNSRATYKKNTNHQQMHNEFFFSSIVTHSYMFRPYWVIFRENFLLSLHWRCTLQLSENVLLTVYCVVFGGVNSLRSRDHTEFTPPAHSTQSTAHSHSTVKCNPSVTVTESSPWRWPSRVETCRRVLRLMIKLSLCICWWGKKSDTESEELKFSDPAAEPA